MLDYFKILRPKNLFLVAVTQLLIYYLVILPSFSALNLEPRLSGILLPLFITCTVLIAAAGYVVNDIFDSASDQINKPDYTFIGRNISSIQGWLYYWVLVLCGLFIAGYIALKIDALPLLIIYPLAVGLLYAYSRYLKSNGLIGNVVVALFTAFVPAIILVAEPTLLSAEHETTRNLIVFFATLSFMINLCRELVKDMEDIKGDKVAGEYTLPITIGVEKTKAIVYYLTAISLFLIIGFIYYLFEVLTFRSIGFVMIFVVALLVVSLARLAKAEKQIEFHKVSTLYKLIMLCGLLFLIIQQTGM